MMISCKPVHRIPIDIGEINVGPLSAYHRINIFAEMIEYMAEIKTNIAFVIRGAAKKVAITTAKLAVTQNSNIRSDASRAASRVE